MHVFYKQTRKNEAGSILYTSYLNKQGKTKKVEYYTRQL